eukprot:1149730-Pelagomonas_calceolata.AAC.5
MQVITLSDKKSGMVCIPGRAGMQGCRPSHSVIQKSGLVCIPGRAGMQGVQGCRSSHPVIKKERHGAGCAIAFCEQNVASLLYSSSEQHGVCFPACRAAAGNDVAPVMGHATAHPLPTGP